MHTPETWRIPYTSLYVLFRVLVTRYRAKSLIFMPWGKYTIYEYMSKNNIYRSAALVTVFSTVEKTLSFVYRIILSRAIGAEGVGIYQICLSVFAVFLTAASSGIPITVSRVMSKHGAEGNLAAKHGAVSSGIALALIFTVPIAIVLLLAKNLYGFLFPNEDCLDIFLWLLPGLVLTSVYAVMRGSFWGNRQFLPYSVIELAENTVMVIAGCILISFASTPEGGALSAVIAVLISYVFSFCTSLICYRIKGGRFVDPRPQLRPIFSAAMPITVMRTSTSLLNSVIAMFLPALLTSACGYTDGEAVALYGVVMGMSLPMLFTPNSLIGSIAVVVAPELSEDFYANRTENLKRDIERTIRASVLIAAVLIPVMFTLGECLGIFFFDNEFSGIIIERFAFIMLPLSLSMITTTILNSMNFEVQTLIHFFIGALVLLACILVLTPRIGIYAYMVGETLDVSVTAALNLRLLHKNSKGINYGLYTLKSFIIAAVSCLFGRLTDNLFADALSPFWRIIVSGGLVFLFACLTFYGMEMASAKPLKKLFARGDRANARR